MHAAYDNYSRRCGITLIEVVASLALLATLLTAILVAQGRHQKQVQQARLKLQACQAADALLHGWFTTNDPIPSAATGVIEGNEELTWQTQPLRASDLRDLGLTVIRLVVSQRRPDEAERKEFVPLVTVDLLSSEVMGTQVLGARR